MSIQRAKISSLKVKDADTTTALNELRASVFDVSFLRGARLLEDIQLTGGTTSQIPHGLGRQLNGYLVVRSNAGAGLGYLYDLQETSPDTDRYLYLRPEGYSPKITLVVF